MSTKMTSSSSMETLRQKLDSGNVIIVNQALSKLHKTLLEKCPSGKRLINSENKIPELEFLWEKCLDNCAVVSNGMCSILKSLVFKGCADNSFVIKKLTNLASSSASNSGNIVESLCVLLTSEIFSSNQLSSPYFNLRSPLHPIVQLLIEKPNFWPIVLEQMKLLLPSNNERLLQHNLSVFSPILQFALWDPSRNTGFSTFRIKLLRHLVETSNSSSVNDLKEFLYRCIFWLQVDCYEALLESSWHLQEIAELFTNPLYDTHGNFIDTVLLALVSLCLDMVHVNMDISRCVEIVKSLAKSTQQTLATDSTCATLIILSVLLEDALPSHQPTIIHICSMLLSRDGINSVVMGILFLPLLLVLYSSTVPTRTTSSLKQETLKLTNFIQEKLNTGFAEQLSNVLVKKLSSPGPFFHYEARNYCTQATFAFELSRIAGEISSLPAAAYDWLQHSHDVLLFTKKMIKSQLYLISSVFLHNFKEGKILKKCCEVLIDIAKICQELAPSIFIMMLHKLKMEKNPEMQLCILTAIPHLGIHKLSMHIVLPTLRYFIKVPQLLPFAIRLLSLLWHHQERVYPYLLERLVNDKDDPFISSDVGLDEILVAKATAILDICKSKPHLHGAELLKVLSRIILDNRNVSGTSPTVLALESIICLCKAEVIDLVTTWRFLSPIFNDDKRPLVIQKWFELLSLAEMLKLQTEENENFLNQAVAFLWHNVQMENCAGAAFTTLACFDITRHSVEHIPMKVKTILDQNIVSSKEIKHSSEDVTSFTLGRYLVELLMNISVADLNDYGQFLQAVVCQEVRSMPRSVLNFSKVQAEFHGSKKRSSVLDLIPSYLIEKFESNPPPSTVGNLALSLLLAYHPKVGPQSAIHSSKSYCNMLETLLFKVTLDISEWRMCNMYSFAWGIFMERLFHSMINAHEAQTTLQHKTGDQRLTEAENAPIGWLWARDKICDILKNAARSNLAVHGNTIVALAGLVAAVNKYALLNVEKVVNDVETPEYLLHKNWMSEVLTTILNILKPGAQIQQGIFSWCYLAAGMPINALQPFVAFSTVLLAPTVVLTDIDIISELLLAISHLLYSSPPSSPILQFSLSLSLGQLLSQLSMEHFADVGDEAKSLLLTHANKLKQWCFDMEDSLLSTRNGGILGLSMVVSSFCQEKCGEFQDFILDAVEEFDRQGRKSDSLPNSLREVLLIGRVLVATSACGCGLCSIDFVKSLYLELEGIVLNDSASAIAYGLIIQYLAKTGDKDFVKLNEVQFQTWMKTMKTGGTKEVVAAVNGLFSLFPICLESKFMPGYTLKALEVRKSDSDLTDFIRCLSKDLPLTSFDMSVQNCSFWILGATYCSLTNESSSICAEPLDYSYLDSRSTLRSILDFILNNIKSGIKPELYPHILTSLKCLEQDAGQRFPPMNWSSLLKPVLFISKEIQLVAVGIALAQSRYSPSAAALLTSLLISNSFVQLEEFSQIKIFLHLPKLINILSTKSIHIFLTKHITTVFSLKNGSALPIAFVKGILNTMSITNLSCEIMETLCLTVVNMFHHIDPHVKDVWELFGKAALKLPDDIQDQMTLVDTKQYGNILKIARIRAVVVGYRHRPLQWLNECIDALAALPLNGRESELNLIISEYCDCFLKCSSSEIYSEDCMEVDPVSWVFELMGHIRNVLEGCSSLPIENENHMREVVSFLFIIFGLYITSLVDKEFGCDYYLWVPKNTALSSIVLQILPAALLHLVVKKSWRLHTKKFIFWFDFLLKSGLIQDDIESCLKACLLHFRHCPELKIFDIWTHVMELCV